MKPVAPRHEFGELCAAALRALTGDAELSWHGRMFHCGERPLPTHAPHLRLDSETAPLPDRRAAADGMALLLRYSDPELRRRLRPEDAIERLVYELLEQLRVETLAPGEMPASEAISAIVADAMPFWANTRVAASRMLWRRASR